MNFKFILKGVFGSYLMLFGFIALFAFILANSNINDSLIKPVMIGITFLTLSINTFINVRKVDTKGYIYGLIIGIIYAVILFIISLILNKNIELSMYSYIQILVSIVAGMLGGILSVNIK